MKTDTGLNVYFEKLLQMFTNAFEDYQDKRIVLYGIGAFSATVIERLTDFHIVGLMDRDPENIGKVLYGIPILSKEQAEREADLIIINTEASYWQTIYKRIQDIRIDVYYRNGRKAYLDNTPKCDVNLEYWSSGKEELLQKIDECSTISFDIFDTLLTRKVYLPADVFSLVELRLRNEMGGVIPFSELRTKALHTTGVEEPTYDEIYEQFKRLSKLDRETVERIKQFEFDIEKQLLVPRDEMLDVYHYAREKNKKIILTSDMYYQTERLKELLDAFGIIGYEEIFVSCEYRKTKQSGQLYEEVFKKYDKSTLLHIGDNKYSDYDRVIQEGGNAYFVMSGRELLAHSSLSEIIPHICTVMDSLIIGTVVAKILNDPFVLCGKKGTIYYEDAKSMGYSVFGPMIFGFMHWLWKSAVSNKIEKLLFFARDGYFLQNYFDQLQDFCQEKDRVETEYFLISRRLAAVASICDETTFIEVAKLPYEGIFAEYMEKRWNVIIDKEDPFYDTVINTSLHFDELLKNMMRYQNEIEESVTRDKKNYRKYCEKEIANKKIAIVDTWYYGNCQWYLSQIINKPIKGYYFAANLSNDNRNFLYNDLAACYNTEKGSKGGHVSCLKNSLHFESIFTSPQGMIRSCTEDGGFLYEKKGRNQQEFRLREEMAEGVRNFISDLLPLVGKATLEEQSFDYGFCDRLYGLYWDDSIAISKEISTKMYNENYFQSSKEFLIIED